MVEEARSFAEKAHEGQFRKGTKRPYIVHPLEVAKIVSTMKMMRRLSVQPCFTIHLKTAGR
jgi:(p)ppGpp synthase/HD superfamily hydrolase